jgi:hypothetical protein
MAVSYLCIAYMLNLAEVRGPQFGTTFSVIFGAFMACYVFSLIWAMVRIINLINFVAAVFFGLVTGLIGVQAVFRFINDSE